MDFYFYVINIYNKCTWVIPLKHKKGNIITNAFQNILNESKRYKDSQFYNRSIKSFL